MKIMKGKKEKKNRANFDGLEFFLKKETKDRQVKKRRGKKEKVKRRFYYLKGTKKIILKKRKALDFLNNTGCVLYSRWQ